MTPEEIFAQLGFNALEAEVYVALLKHGPQTAYKVGKLLNRPTANVYKAVDVLANSGAIEIEEGDIKICKAIPIKALTQQLQRSYKNKIDSAVDQLSVIKPEINEEGIYKLQTVESVFQRVNEMLKRCTNIAVIDSFPKPLEIIGSDLNKLAKKGIDVFVEAYDEIELDKSISISMPVVRNESLKYWNAQQLNVAIDGKEMLVAIFNADLTEVIQATYSNSNYLACIMFIGLLNEHRVHKFMNAKTLKEFEEVKNGQKYFYNSKIPGVESLFKLYKKD